MKLPLNERLLRLTNSPEGISFEESLQAVAAHMYRMGKNYIEIGVNLKTAEIGWSFETLLNQSIN